MQFLKIHQFCHSPLKIIARQKHFKSFNKNNKVPARKRLGPKRIINGAWSFSSTGKSHANARRTRSNHPEIITPVFNRCGPNSANASSSLGTDKPSVVIDWVELERVHKIVWCLLMFGLGRFFKSICKNIGLEEDLSESYKMLVHWTIKCVGS